jgi:hypothetical protein
VAGVEGVVAERPPPPVVVAGQLALPVDGESVDAA